jgi:hypothetical protein
MKNFKTLVVLLLAFAAAGTMRAQEPFQAGTVAGFAGKSFVFGGVTYTFPEDDYSFSGSGVTSVPASAVAIRVDPSGPDTLLISSPFWALNQPGQSISIDIRFQVTGANVQESEQYRASATGDARISQSITVEGNPPTVSTSFRTATDGVNLPPPAWFAEGPHDVVVHISLVSGQKGTAVLRSYRMRFAHRERPAGPADIKN